MRNLSESKRSLALRAIGLTFIVLICAGSLQAQRFGYVLDIRGEWILNGNSAARLSKGSALNVGGVITAANPADSGSYIVVADRSGNIFEKRNCGAAECTKPIRLPNSVGEERSLVSRLIGAAMALVSNEPAKYSSFVSRGADLREAVVKLSNEQLDLREVFKNMPSNRYLVRFEQISKDRPASSQTLKPFAFGWDPRKPAPLVTHGVGPGLY